MTETPSGKILLHLQLREDIVKGIKKLAREDQLDLSNVDQIFLDRSLEWDLVLAKKPQILQDTKRFQDHMTERNLRLKGLGTNWESIKKDLLILELDDDDFQSKKMVSQWLMMARSYHCQVIVVYVNLDPLPYWFRTLAPNLDQLYTGNLNLTEKDRKLLDPDQLELVRNLNL